MAILIACKKRRLKTGLKMKKILVEIEYNNLPHLSQIYTGLNILATRKVINLKYLKKSEVTNKPVVTAFINSKCKVIIDTLDGFNWIDNASIDKNLDYFATHFDCDYYFKRSYHKLLNDYNFSKRNILPLGFNYHMKHEQESYNPLNKMKNLVYKMTNSTNLTLDYSEFESYPLKNQENKILFLARLWQPEDVKNENLQRERELINNVRIESIRKCRKEFGDMFTGGLQHTDYAEKIAKDLIVPNIKTSKLEYIKTIKSHNICISTLGLHKSNGWKIAEYVAASRAIISEPLYFEVENFEENYNYLKFHTSDDLIEKIYLLMNNKQQQFSIMENNYKFYQTQLRPDSLLLNVINQSLNYFN